MREAKQLTHKERGTSLIEMMIAMLVLTIGLLGTITVATTSLRSDNRSKHDSTSTALAEMVADQISAVPLAGGTTSITITDCASNAWTVKTTGTAAGSGATLNSSGNIDFINQTYASVPAGYAMKYVVCGTSSGINMSYDVRWNIKATASGSEQFVVAGVQPVINNSTNNPAMWAPPVNVRTVAGNDGN
jgi:type IV pilus modification protein PilV